VIREDRWVKEDVVVVDGIVGNGTDCFVEGRIETVPYYQRVLTRIVRGKLLELMHQRGDIVFVAVVVQLKVFYHPPDYLMLLLL